MDRYIMCLCFFILTVSFAFGLQIDLEDTEVQLTSYEEDQVFAFLPVRPENYKVLLPKAGRHRRSSESLDTIADRGEFTLRITIDEKELNLNFARVNDFASPGLTLSLGETAVTNEASEGRNGDLIQMANLTDCIYEASDASSVWAVVSACGRMTGLLEFGGQSFQLEDVTDLLKDSSRFRRATDRDGVYVISPIDIKVRGRMDPPRALEDAKDFIDMPFDLASTSNLPKVGHAEKGKIIVKRHTERAKSDSLTVELMVFVDKKMVNYVEKRFPRKDPSREASNIVLVLTKAVDRLYSTISAGKSRIRIKLKGIQILGSGEPKGKEGDIYNYLIDFCKWQKLERKKKMSSDLSKAWDHGLLLTGHDLWSEGTRGTPRDYSTVGLAYVGGMCSNSYSCTVAEATSLAAAYIIAHEMGHSLGMDHDGSKSASSCSDVSDRHIMSPVMRSGAVTWSQCSENSLKKFVDKKGSCLENEYGKTHMAFFDEAAGQIYDADSQCHYMYGEKWSHKSNTMDEKFKDVCSTLWCRNGISYRTPNAGALDGTPCTENKYCLSAKCITSEMFKRRYPSSSESNDMLNSIIKDGNEVRNEPNEKGETDQCKRTPKSNGILSSVLRYFLKMFGLTSDNCESQSPTARS